MEMTAKDSNIVGSGSHPTTVSALSPKAGFFNFTQRWQNSSLKKYIGGESLTTNEVDAIMNTLTLINDSGIRIGTGCKKPWPAKVVQKLVLTRRRAFKSYTEKQLMRAMEPCMLP
jgi:hypothetical protein